MYLENLNACRLSSFHSSELIKSLFNLSFPLAKGHWSNANNLWVLHAEAVPYGHNGLIIMIQVVNIHRNMLKQMTVKDGTPLI